MIFVLMSMHVSASEKAVQEVRNRTNDGVLWGI